MHENITPLKLWNKKSATVSDGTLKSYKSKIKLQIFFYEPDYLSLQK